MTIVSVLGLVVAVAFTAYLATGRGSPRASAAKTKQTIPAPTGAAAAPTPATPAPATPHPHAIVRVVIRAKGHASWLEIRRGSATGPVLFSGELAPGKALHLAGRRLWARFGAAGNLTITANRRPVTLVGTYEHVFVATKR